MELNGGPLPGLRRRAETTGQGGMGGHPLSRGRQAHFLGLQETPAQVLGLLNVLQVGVPRPLLTGRGSAGNSGAHQQPFTAISSCLGPRRALFWISSP